MKGRKKSKEGAVSKKKTGAKNDEFVKNIGKYVIPKSTLILGVSGGPDSVYLLQRCLEVQKKMRLKLIVAHVDHGLRGKESDNDKKFVQNLCKEKKIPCRSVRINLKKKPGSLTKNVEEAGREARYEYFETLRKRFKAQWILIAHHLNDNIETMLFNLIRGAHLNGIKGMEIASPSRHLLRPLLGITKQEILGYLKKRHIRYRLDASNDNTDFSRNWLRKNIIPLFPKLNPGFEQTFKETLHNLTQTAQYLEHQCEEWLKAQAGCHFKQKWLKKNGPRLDLDTFLNEHPAFQKQLLVHLYKKIHGSTKKLTNKHLEEILNVLRLRQANRKKEFGTGTFIEVIWDPQKNGRGKKRYIRLIGKK